MKLPRPTGTTAKDLLEVLAVRGFSGCTSTNSARGTPRESMHGVSLLWTFRCFFRSTAEFHSGFAPRFRETAVPPLNFCCDDPRGVAPNLGDDPFVYGAGLYFARRNRRAVCCGGNGGRQWQTKNAIAYQAFPLTLTQPTKSHTLPVPQQ